MSQSNENSKIILSTIKLKLSNAVKDRRHGFHTPVFSNITKKGNISSRVVVLRKFDSEKNVINFHTDYRSKKVMEILQEPKTFFIFYDAKDKVQLRISTISTIHRKNDFAMKIWERTPLSSRKCYLARKAPSSKSDFPDDSIPLHLIGADPKKKESEIGYKNFVVVENKIASIEWLHLSSSGHRRLLINTSNKNIKYQWLIP